MLQLADGWQIDVDRGPEWLFFRVRTSADVLGSAPPLAETMWSAAVDHHVDRLVVEFDAACLLSSFVVGQLVLLHKRAHLAGGVVRLCGLSDDQYRVIQAARLAERLPNYPDREAAVMGYRPRKPR